MSEQVLCQRCAQEDPSHHFVHRAEVERRIAAALAAKDAEIERLTRERDEAEHDADEKAHWYRVTEAENERLRTALEKIASIQVATLPLSAWRR